MHPLLTFLADAVRYIGVFADDTGPLRVARLRDILTPVFTDTFSSTQIESLMQTLEAHAATGRHPLPAIDENLLEYLTTRTLSERLAQVAAVLRDLMVLREALLRGHVQRVRLQVGDRILFDAIRSLTFSQGNGQLRHVLIGTLGQANNEQVGPFPQPRPLRDVEIAYHANSSLPHLNLSVGSRSNKDQWEAHRDHFPHRAEPRFDLMLGQRGGNPRGQIKTRVVEESWSIANQLYELIDSPTLKLKLVETFVLDEHENQVLICARVVASDLK